MFETKKIDPEWAWQPYKPSAKAPWNLKRAGHLYRRATFGATFEELQTAIKAGPEKTIDRVLNGADVEKFDQSTATLADSIARVNNGQQLRAWWLYRMLYTPQPLREKLTLFWHNHFATSNAKVQNARFMLGQYRLFQKHALGDFRTLLKEMSLDPAMMVWLDTRDSKKGNPNENYARELMELFSLGIGNYTEQDVREAAKAFTGWTIQGNDVTFRKTEHDDSEKAVLKQKGKWKPDEVVRICLEQECCAPFMVGKLWRFLVSDSITPERALLEPLASAFRKDYDFKALVETVLRSNLFFSETVYRTKIKSPVDFALGIVRGLEGKIGTVALAQALEGLGQNVFYPPSVKGWDGGQGWLNGQTLLFRQNLALALTSTEDVRFNRRTDPATLARTHDKKNDAEDLVEFFLDLFLQGDVPDKTKKRLLEYQENSHKRPVPVYWTEQDAADSRVRSLCHLVLTLPEFQLD